MELINNFTDDVNSILMILNSKKDVSEVGVDSYGVGAMMPHDIPDAVLLNNTALYGV